jgi:tetratricopeptide (TPR) repeat protein
MGDPIFFFSYARADRSGAGTPRLNAQDQGQNNAIDMFYQNLCNQVASLTARPAEEVGFFDRRNLELAAAAGRTDSTNGAKFDPLSLADPAHVASLTSFPVEGHEPPGCLHMIGAGIQNRVYAERVRSFDWAEMFSRLKGAEFVKRFGEKCRGTYDFTLIDSRTGIADTAGIATIVLPSVVVLCFTPNRQNVLGIRAIAESIVAARPQLRLLPVVTRVEKGVEGWREAQEFYRSQLDHLLPASASAALRDAYWGSAEIIYYPNYALGELLATFCDSPTEQNSLLSDMRRLVSRIVESDFMSSSESFGAPEFSQAEKAHYFRRIQFRDPRIAELQSALEGDASSGLIAVSTLAVEASQEVDADPEWLHQIGSTMNKLGIRLSNLGRGEEALAATQGAVDVIRRLAQTSPGAFRADLAESLNNLGNRLSELGRREEALACVQESAELYRELAAAQPDTFQPDLARSLAITQGQIADILTQQGQLDEALRIRREEELPVYSRLGDVRATAITQGQIADILTQQGQLDEALRIRREEELPVYSRLSDVRSAAITQGQIADILTQQGQLDEALRIRREEVLPVYSHLGNVRATALTQGRIADILTQQGQLDEALRIRREEELPVYSRLGDVRSAAITQGQTADILTQQGQLDEALHLQGARLATNRKLQDQDGIAATLCDIGTIELEQNKRVEASSHIGEAWQILSELGRVDAIAVVGELWGQLLTQAGHADEGCEVLRRSSEAYRQLGQTDKSQAVEELIKQL